MSAIRYHFPPFTLDAARRRLYRGADPVPLTPKAVDVLLALVERPRITVEKEELMRRLWPDTAVEEGNLSQQIFTLRKTLGETAGDSRFIATVPRRGYRFVAEVQVETTHAARAREAPAPTHLRFTIALPDTAPIVRLPVPTMALSPDGTELIYVARAGQSTVLCRRSMGDLAVTPVPGTEGATTPFWSPDGAWFAFVAGGLIRRMSRGGTASQTVAEAPQCRGATWTADRQIVYAPGPAEGLWMVAEDGGAPRPLTSIAFEAGERTHRWPSALPDGRILFTLATAGIASFDDASLAVVSPHTRERQVVLPRASDGRALPGGRIAFLRDGGIWTIRLDALTEPAVPLTALAGVAIEATGVAQFTGASDALLVHLHGGRPPHKRALLLTDGRGAEQTVVAPEGEIEEPRLSPSGDRVVVGVRSRTSDLWLCDLERRMFSRVTTTHDNFAAIWTPEGERLTFSSNRRGPTNIFTTRADGSGQEELLVSSDYDLVAGSWSQDGRWLLFTEYHPETGADVWIAWNDGRPPEPLVRTPFNEYSPAWHPHAHCFAFTSDETGEPQVYVKRFPTGPVVRVSAAGGSEPIWSRSGRQLFYRTGDALVWCEITVDDTGLTAGPPSTLLDVAGERGTETGLPNYDIAPDGRVLLVRADSGPMTATALVATLNWRAGGEG